jgi:hypothetical protein
MKRECSSCSALLHVMNVGASCDTGDEASIHDMEIPIVPTFKENDQGCYEEVSYSA